ncbi:MAG: hypothetical protein IT385_08475 [Deltaproteobacteria bacterium]|nr:hypothetical protein [Deltaproteobacteria bacterium]
MNEPLDRRTRELVEAERVVPPLAAGARDRIRARVRSTLASPAPPAPPAAAAASGGLVKLALVLGGIALVVGPVFLITRSTDHAPTTPPPSRAMARLELGGAATAPRFPPPTAPIVIEPPAPAPVEAPIEAPPPAPIPSAELEPPAPPARDAASPEHERRVLERAQAAVALGDFAAALAATREHARRWPRGALTEEREVLRVRALVGQGDVEAARAAATSFRARFPRSIHRAAIDALSPP